MAGSNWTIEEIGPRVENFLQPLLKSAGWSLNFKIGNASGMDPAFERPDFTVEFSGHDLDILLANKGELLLALEHVTLEALRVRPEEHSRLLFDANDYRIMRVEELRLSAETAAGKVKKTGVPFKFSPMTSRERRIIHLALRNDGDVKTESEGVAPHRHVVVYPGSHQTARKSAGR